MRLKTKITIAVMAASLAACGGAETGNQIPTPEFDGFYVLNTSGELELVRSAPATHNNPTYIGGGYCSDQHASNTATVELDDIRGFVVQDINISNLSFHTTHNGGFHGMCTYPEALELRGRSLDGNAYYFEPAEPLESGNLYVGWINRKLWFVRVE